MASLTTHPYFPEYKKQATLATVAMKVVVVELILS
jgi:hypothetical protein